MGDRFKKTRPSVVVAFSGMVLALSGCAGDSYFMVEKEGLEDIRTSVNTQRSTLVTMENNANIRHEHLLNQNQEATQVILDAISTQVEKPVCPPPAAQRECPRVPADAGRADRLKGKVIVGEKEKFYLAGPGLVYTARIDSGAETSSIHARNVQRFERDGSNWVRFEIPVPGSEGKEWLPMEKEISRRVRIVQASADESERRVVVELQFAIGDHQQVAEFTLADRQNLTYEVLIGRNVLRDVMLIDVGKEFATELPEALTSDRNDPDDEEGGDA